MTQPTKVAGTLRRAVRSSAFAGILGGRHMECAYYFDFCGLCVSADAGSIRHVGVALAMEVRRRMRHNVVVATVRDNI
jgi:hypothetical protein